jgi:hypothetical protein
MTGWVSHARANEPLSWVSFGSKVEPIRIPRLD